MIAAEDSRHWLATGIAYVKAGKWADAGSALERAIVADSSNAQAHLELSIVLRRQGRLADSFNQINAALQLNPDFARARGCLAATMIDRGQLEAAEAQYRRAIELSPGDIFLRIELFRLMGRMNRPEDAHSAYLEALKCEPVSPEAFTARALLLAEMKAFDQAVADHQKAIAMSLADVSLHLSLADTLREKGDLISAEQECRQSIASDPESAQAQEALGRLLQSIGRFQEAAGCFRKSLAISPGGAGCILLAGISPQLEPADEQRLQAMANDPRLEIRDRIAAGFARGDLLDKADRFDEAFAAYHQANASFRDYSSQVGERFDPELLTRQIDETITTTTADFFAARLDFGQKTETPVFIVGMPRSGTTLVEQILASHSKVFGAGELPDIGITRARLTAMNLENSPRHWQRHWHRHMAKLHLARLDMLAGSAGENRARIVDKTPANILHLGLIAVMFPGARAIFCHREPRDTCLSCYFQLFPDHNLMFSYDLADCATQYHQQQRLTAHWKQVLPLQMLDVTYEKLVTDLPGQSHRLIDFLNLDWEPACLDFHKTTRPILTQSAWQVRQPIYTRSVGRWRNYEKPLRKMLKDAEFLDLK